MFEVGDRVCIKKIGLTGKIISVSDYRHPSMKYVVDIDGNWTHSYFCGEDDLEPEDVMRALECCGQVKFCATCPYLDLNNGLCQEDLQTDALALLRSYREKTEWLNKEVDRLSQVVLYHDGQIADKDLDIAEKDAEIERLKHSKGVAQVNIINEIANRMQIKEFNSHEIATGYAWAINDLLKLLLELKKKVMRGNKDGQM